VNVPPPSLSIYIHTLIPYRSLAYFNYHFVLSAYANVPIIVVFLLSYPMVVSSLENWGGATFDVAMRFLNECPWDR
jgi:hypothetical protein